MPLSRSSSSVRQARGGEGRAVAARRPRRALAASGPQRQRGVVALAILVIFIAATSYLLVTQLNKAARQYAREQQTAAALAEAKQALIGYAMTYAEQYPPFGPGYLPCPDTSGNGNPNPPCAPNAVGRLPWRILALDQAVDVDGEALWYAVSADFRNNPKTSSPMNSELPGTLSLDGAGDVVAVIIAPGPSLSGQDRPSDSAVAYLEGGNEIADGSFFTSAAAPDGFNDRVLAITRAELMAAVEERVLGEAAKLLRDYRDRYGSYPWLSPYAAPSQSTPLLSGTAGAGSAGTVLVDPALDFPAMGVRPGDVIHNVSDGSVGRVDAVVASDSLQIDRLRGGMSNVFAPGNGYAVARFNGWLFAAPGAPSGRFGHIPYHVDGEGFATGLVLDWDLLEADGAEVDVTPIGGGVLAHSLPEYEPALRAFVQRSPYRTGDGNGGTLVGAPLQVGPDQGLCIWRGRDILDCWADAILDFISGEADAGSTDAVLADPAKDFIVSGVQPGDLLVNLSDASWGVIDQALPQSVRAIVLAGGGSNAFSPGDAYRVRVATRLWPRQDGIAGPATAGCDVEDPSVADFGDAPFLVDSEDRVATPDGGLWRIVGVSGSTLSLEPGACPLLPPVPPAPPGPPAPGNALEPGDTYEVLYAARPGTGSLGGGWQRLRDERRDFAAEGISLGDVVIFPTKDAYGVVADVGDPLDIDELRLFPVTDSGGTPVDLTAGDPYLIRTGFIEERRYAIRLDYGVPGGAAVTPDPDLDADPPEAPPGPPDNVKQRSVQAIGTLPSQAGGPVLTVEDRDLTGALLASATVRLPSPPATGRIVVSGLHMDLERGVDLPAWFIDNAWHNLLLVGVAEGMQPGGALTCTAGTGCLTVRLGIPDPGDPASDPGEDDRQVVVVSAGPALPGQDRSVGALEDYFEHENAMDEDEVFRRAPADADINDRIRVVSP